MLRLGLPLVLVLASCSHKPTTERRAETSSMPISDCARIADCRLFPFGTYDQDVSVTVAIKSEHQQHDFNCVVRTAADELALVGHTGLGTPLFQIHQKSDQEPQFKTSISQIEQNKDFFLRVFHLIKDIFSMKRTDPRMTGSRIALQPATLKANAQFFDFQNQVPQRILINSTEGLFEVKVKTRSSTLESQLRTETNHH